VLVVDVPESIQLARTMMRDNATKEEVTRIMQSQLPRGKRLAAADDIVENSGDPLQLQEQLLRLIARYEELAHARHQID
jgi:dephospho-CoA kinase